jgi:hypothetical protein
MLAMPLAHISWAIADNDVRKACDAFFIDVFGAQTAYEIRVSAETEAMGLDREERLMMVGDTMLIPIAPAGRGTSPDSPIGDMLRRSSAPGRWLGIALKTKDLGLADAWLRSRGFKLHYDPGMEKHYFLIGRGQALGVRIEVMVHDLPNDPRLDTHWTAAWWRDSHPLGIEGLQSIGVSVPSLADARELFAAKLDWPEIGTRILPGDAADCAAFAMRDAALEAMHAHEPNSALARHARDIKGIYCLTFKVRSGATAANYLRAKGLELIGDVSERFAIRPDQAFDRLLYFTDKDVPGYPPLGSKIERR